MFDFDAIRKYVTGNNKFLEYQKNGKVECVYVSEVHKNQWRRIL